MSAVRPLFECMAVIGLGLIGSSLALAARRYGLVSRVVGSARTQATGQVALQLGVIERFYDSAAEAVAEADLVMLCVPVGAFANLAEQINPYLQPGCVVSDVGSVKAAVARELLLRIPTGVHLVPGHPVAGTEHSGPESGFANLFEGRWCILTPHPECDEAAVERVSALWQGCGAMVERMSAHSHDRLMAMTSHLPHLVAYALVGTALDLGDDLRADLARFSAGGFRDFTRIAASDPVMWRDIFLHNRESVLEMLERLSAELARLHQAVLHSEGEKLHGAFARARELRQGVIQTGQAFGPHPPSHDGRSR